MPYSRRLFIRKTIAGGFIGVLINPFSKLFSLPTRAAVSWEALVEYARWCPTVHNMQPHKIKIISATICELHYDPSRLLPVGDPESMFATVAMGIFIEHLSIAAADKNMKVEIMKTFEPINNRNKNITLFAVLQLVPAEKKEELDRALILKRRTSRIQYNFKELSGSCVNRLIKESSFYKHSLTASSDKELIKEIIDLNQSTLFKDLESAPDRKELDHLFRYTKEDAMEKRDGLWSKCMGFPGSLMKSVFHHYKFWDSGIAKRLLSNHYKKAFEGTSTICWVSGKFDTTEDWLRSGKMLARLWLILTSENAYIHPFGSLITNSDAYKIINNRLPKAAEETKIWMIFRAGYSEEPCRSFRLNTNEIII